MRNKIEDTDEKAVAFKVTTKIYFKYNKQGHVAKDCKIKTIKDVRCYNCNKESHLSKSCNEKTKNRRF